MILWFGEPDCHRRETVGGKAVNLSRLAAAYPVPPGFCLTAAAFAAKQSVSLMDGFCHGVATAYETLATGSATPDPSVAVRSSAMDEDGVASSFAGQYESYLNVTGVEAVLRAIGHCWASASSERIRAYRQQQGLADSMPLAVLVQQLVSADTSAVVFSANPVTKDTEQVVINVSWGLGESIVGGTVTPDTFVVDKSSLALVSADIANKQRMTVRSDAGTQEVNVPRFLRTQPTLNDQQIREMAQLALSLEQEMGWPVDVECAYQADQLFLLQCRPITALRSD